MKTLSIDLGGSNVKLGIVCDGKVILSKSTPSESHLGLAPLLPKIEKTCKEWLSAAELDAVGIAFPSLVDVDRKYILGHNNKFADYAEVDLKGWVEEKFHAPMVMDNDANAAALGEGRYGCAAGCEDFILMILGTGIGTAAVMNGELLRGKHYQAGVLLGHAPLKAHGRKCVGCSGVGCAEAQASTWALPHMVKESNIESPLKSERKIDFKLLKSYCEKGDPLAKAVFDECCDYWANCLLNLICAYDPEMVVLSGGVMNWGSELEERLIDMVKERAWTPWGTLDFRRVENAEHSVLLGLHALCENEKKGKSKNCK